MAEILGATRGGATLAWARRAPLWPLVAALVVYAAMLFRPGVLNDGDTYWHLAAGAWMLDHRQVLTRDVFSFTAAGVPWISHEWLSEVAMAAAWRAGGWSGLVLLFAAATGLAFGLIARTLSRALPPLSVALGLSLALALAAPSLLTRPHVLALPILVGWTALLMHAREESRAPAPWLALVMALWANTHGSFVFGFLLAAAFGLEALTAPGANRLKVVRDWGLLGGLCLAAALATPHGIEGLVYPFRIMGMQTLNAIDEWRPQDFGRPGLFELGVLATLGLCLYRGVRVPAVRLALLILLLHMALQHQRHQIVLALVAPLLLAGPFAAVLEPAQAGRRAPRWATPAVAAALLVLTGVRLALPLDRGDGPNTPVAALAHVPAALMQRPVINSYGFGGYLIFSGSKAFIDGRADMYGDAFVRRYVAVQSARPAAVEAALRDYRIDWTVLEPGTPLIGVLDRRPGWRRLYADRYAVVHVREAALP